MNAGRQGSRSEKLHRHGPLSSSFLHAYCEREGFRNEGRTLDALK
jgi:hypothetical protein